MKALALLAWVIFIGWLLITVAPYVLLYFAFR